MEETTKKSNTTLWVIIGVILIVAALVFVLVAMAINHSTSPTATTTPSSDMSMSSSSSTSADTSNATATNEVEIDNYAFKPSVITVKTGTTVTWTNKDSVEHTVTADKASSDAPNSPLFGDGKTYSFTFNKAGTYAYHCTPHPYMKGTVVVTE